MLVVLSVHMNVFSISFYLMITQWTVGNDTKIQQAVAKIIPAVHGLKSCNI